jgi:phage/plasmid-associated DNA primase
MAKPNRLKIVKKDGFFSSIGIRIFRNKKATKENEFIFYYIDTGAIFEYSKTRALEILLDEIKERSEYERVEKMCEPAKLKPLELIKEFFDSEYLLIEGTTYEPTDSLCVFQNKNRLLNTYKAPSILKKTKEITHTNFPTINKIMDNLVGFDANAKEWVFNWLAGIFQTPTIKVTTGIIFHGDQGTGKGLVFEKIMSKMLETNYNKVGFNQLNSEFNSWLKNVQLVFCNEITHYENKQQVSQSMKDYISESTFTLREMRKDPCIYPNYTRIIVASNGMIPFRVETTDRRWSVFKSKKLSDGYNVYKMLNENIEEECLGFLNFLLNYKIDKKKENSPYLNQERTDIVKANMNSCEAFIYEIESQKNLRDFIDEYKSYTQEKDSLVIDSFSDGYIVYENKEYMFSRELYRLYEEFCRNEGYGHKAYRNTLTSHLKSVGYETERITINGVRSRAVCFTKNND